MEAVKYLNLLQSCGRKSFEWWEDESLCQARTTPYLTVQPLHGKVGVWIVCPPDKWFNVADVSKFFDRCRKALGNEVEVLKAYIVADRRQRLYLYWSENETFWRECEQVLANWKRLKEPTAKVISMCLSDTFPELTTNKVRNQ